MADRLVGLSSVTRADPVPAHEGRALVRYLGGRGQAVRTLTGFAHRPRRDEYPKGERGAQRHADAVRTWKSAQTRVRRWDEGARAPKLTATDKRRAQAANRAHKARTLRTLRVRIHGDVVVPSDGYYDTRTRWTPEPYSPGFAIAAGPVMAAKATGGDAAAIQAVIDQVLTPEVSTFPAFTRFDDATVLVWREGEREPKAPDVE